MEREIKKWTDKYGTVCVLTVPDETVKKEMLFDAMKLAHEKLKQKTWKT